MRLLQDITNVTLPRGNCHPEPQAKDLSARPRITTPAFARDTKYFFNNLVMKKRQNSQGQIIIIVVLMITLFLATVSSFVLLILGEMRSQRAMSDSLVAYYAAEAGVEKVILRIKQDLPYMPYNNEGTLGEASYQYTYYKEVASDKITYTINSTGTKNQVKRKIVATVTVLIDPSTGAPIPPDVYWPIPWKEANPSL